MRIDAIKSRINTNIKELRNLTLNEYVFICVLDAYKHAYEYLEISQQSKR
jgi:hypothetical protein